MKSKPHILFIMTDQLRVDAVGYGPEGRFATPNINRIASGSAFTACQSTNPVCQPARSSLLTGKYTHQIGLRTMSGDLSQQHATFARGLQGAGYYTAAVGKLHYLQSWPWGTARGGGTNLAGMNDFFRNYGFDHVWQSAGKQLAIRDYCDWCVYLEEHGLLETFRDYSEAAGSNEDFPNPGLAGDGRPLPFAAEHHVDSVTGRKALGILRERPQDQPLFLMASFCSPHKPFDPPQEYLDRVPYWEEDDFLPDAEGGAELTPEMKKTFWKLRQAYLATVLLVDDQIGLLLDELEAQGIADQTLVLFSSDHGEMMGDHGRVQKQSFYRHSLTVPTALRVPGAPQGLVHDSPVELTDLTATMLDAAGLDPQQVLGSKTWPVGHNTVPCRSLLPMARGEQSSVRDFSFSEGRDWECLQSKDYKYVRRFRSGPEGPPDELLFDLRNDRHELRNRAFDPKFTGVLEGFRARREWIFDQTPPAQF